MILSILYYVAQRQISDKDFDGAKQTLAQIPLTYDHPYRGVQLNTLRLEKSLETEIQISRAIEIWGASESDC